MKADIRDIAKLARLEVSEVDLQVFDRQLTKALDFFSEISKVPTEGVDPLVNPIEELMNWREDKVVQTTTVDEILQNAPDAQGHLFRVPPVV